MEVVWLAFGLLFLALELLGYRREGTPGTLSGLVWRWAGASLGRALFVFGLALALALHLAFGWPW